MEHLIRFLSDNKETIRPIWFITGFVALFVFNKTRPSFYKNRTVLFWVGSIFYCGMLGPLMFLFSMLTLLNPEKAV